MAASFSRCTKLAVLTFHVTNFVGSGNLSLEYLRWSNNESIQLCITSFVFRAVLGLQSLTCIEAILMVRVYASFNRSRSAGRFLLVIFLFCWALQAFPFLHIIRALSESVSCIAPPTPRCSIKIIGFGAALCHSIILLLVIWRYRYKRQDGWARTPLASALVHDGVVTCLLVGGECRLHS
ncbi:hypothetical protein CPB83DRAFT_164649 [Crepidotus variabilis]|uniref:Uncharacterized protein n=1 Tax=Crepidotus variabilis TaxID=179855 RepID=A0A9P6EIW4_9AGAR|nr:hypothetical protein CPB83DRAFT_164649 [Crepidotus variabilis]